ncbi:hypothetical protein DEDE109153_17380 [Deinococcus deserti]
MTACLLGKTARPSTHTTSSAQPVASSGHSLVHALVSQGDEFLHFFRFAE